MTKKPNAKRVARDLITLVAILGIGLGLFQLWQRSHSNTIRIGDTRITKADVEAYAKEVDSFKRNHPQANFGASSKQVAVDDLVLNAALRQEVNKRGKSLANNDLLLPVKDIYKDKASQQNYINSIINGGSRMRLVRAQNAAYETRYIGELLTDKSILIARVSFDTPFFIRASNDDIQADYDQARAKLTNQILPLFKQKATKEEIAKHADAVTFNNTVVDTKKNFSQSVIGLDYIPHYTRGVTTFNEVSAPGDLHGNVGKLENTDDEIAKLKNVGDYSGVFTSKTLAFMIVRLERKSGGPYNSWTDLLSTYKQKYVPAHFSLNGLKLNFASEAMHTLNRVVYSLSSIGQDKAEAWIPPCSRRQVDFVGYSYDVTNNVFIGGTKFHEYRNPADVDPTNNCGFGVSGTVYATTGSAPGNTITDDVFSGEPDWGIDSFSSGYQPVAGGPYRPPQGSTASWSNSVGGQLITVRNGGGRVVSNPATDNYYTNDGWPQWSDKLNDDSPINIYFIYQGPANQPPVGSVTLTCSDVTITGAYDQDHPNDPVNVRVTHNKGNYYGGYYSSNTIVDYTATVQRNANAQQKFRNNTTYQFQVQDEDTNNWVTTDQFDLKNCASGGGGGGSSSNNQGVLSCENYSRTLNDHSIYKFTAYSRRQTYVRSTPTGGGSTGYYGQNNSSRGPWAQLATGEDYHSGEINTNGSYSDSSGDDGSSGDYYRDRDGSSDSSGGGYYSTLDKLKNISLWATAYADSNGGSGYYGDSSFTPTTAGYYAPTQSGTYSLTLPPPNGPDRVVIAEEWHHNSDGSWSYTIDTDSIQDCYVASCNISIDANVPGTSTGVQAGRNFTVHASITNTGKANLPGYFSTNQLVLAGDSNNGNNDVEPVTNNADIKPGQTFNLNDFGMTAPTQITSYLLGFIPGYQNRFNLGSACQTQVDSYQHFSVLPHAKVASDDENPLPLTYKTGGEKVEAPDVTTTDHSWLTHQSLGGPATTVDGVHDSPNRTFGTPADESFTYNPTPPPAVVPGEKYCANVRIDDGSGWIGPGGAKADVQPANLSDCLTVSNKPYVHFMGADVSAGGGFGNNCSKTVAGIKTFVSDVGARTVGSGVQLGALSIAPIEGFNSANLRGSSPTGSTGLSFANTSVPPYDGSDDPDLGGDLGGTHCVPDYFSLMPDSLSKAPPNTGTSITLQRNGTETDYYVPSSGTLTIDSTGFPFPFSKNVTLYVKGNVVIKSNLLYNPGSYTSLDDISSIYIIVKGNIYIDPGVSELDGHYIAENNGPNTGGIYTCANGTTEVDKDQRLQNCNNQLVVNGAFVAQHTYLDRAFGSLRYSSQGEHYTYPTILPPPFGPGVLKTCGSPADRTLYNDCAGEIFNFTSEELVGQPAMNPISGQSTGQYDVEENLSPVI